VSKRTNMIEVITSLLSVGELNRGQLAT